MSLRFQLEGDAAEKIRQLAGTRLESARTQLVREAMINTLQATIERNPVDTARSRAAWVSSLEELGGTPPAGWEGPHPTAADAGRQLGDLSLNDSGQISEARAVNAVSYISFLEYGSSGRSPKAMVRGALQQVAGRLREFFRF